MNDILKNKENGYNNKKLNDIKPIIHMLIGAFIISFSGVYAKLVNVPPTVSAFYRMFFGGIVLLVIIALKKRQYWHSWPYFILTVTAGLVIALDLIVWHKGIQYIGPGLATILGNFQVFIMALFGVIVFKEKLSSRFVVAILLAMVGLFLMTGVNWSNASESYQIGIYLGLATAVCYAVYILILRVIQIMENPLSAITNLTIITVVAALTLFTTVILNQESLVIPDTPSFIYLLCYGILCQVVGWSIIVNTLPQIKASLTGFILLLQPALSFVWDVLLFDRVLNWYISIGIVVTLTAIYLGTTGHSSERKR